MKHKIFDGQHTVKRHVPNRTETSGSVSWIFAFGDKIFFPLCRAIFDLKSISVTWLISRADLNLIYSNAKWFTVLLTQARSYISSAPGLCKSMFR